MRKVISLLICLFTFIPYSAYAILSMELTRGVAGAIPIAIVPFAPPQAAPQNVSGIVTDDLKNSGRFKVSSQEEAHNIVVGKVEALGNDRYQVSFQLLEAFQGKNAQNAVLTKKYTVPGSELRAVAHHISDLVYEQLVGTRGVFSTRIAYVVVQRPASTPAR
ncbi:MAG: Tol-Pal system beta propeller repeat protein TolB, partial [Gammaproteobacteria bacterium]